MYFDTEMGTYKPAPNQGPASFIQELIDKYRRDRHSLLGIYDHVPLRVMEDSTFESLLSKYLEAQKNKDEVESVDTPKIIKKVKIFYDCPGASNDDLEDRINNFIEDKNVESIQYVISDKKHGAMIIYTEVDE